MRLPHSHAGPTSSHSDRGGSRHRGGRGGPAGPGGTGYDGDEADSAALGVARAKESRRATRREVRVSTSCITGPPLAPPPISLRWMQKRIAEILDVLLRRCLQPLREEQVRRHDGRFLSFHDFSTASTRSMQESGIDAEVLARRSALVLALLCGPGFAAGLPVPCFKRRDPAEFLLAGGSNPHKRRRLQYGAGGTSGQSALEAAIAASLAAVGGGAAAAVGAPAPAAPLLATPETLAAALVAGGQGCMDAVASAAPRFASLKVGFATRSYRVASASAPPIFCTHLSRNRASRQSTS